MSISISAIWSSIPIAVFSCVFGDSMIGVNVHSGSLLVVDRMDVVALCRISEDQAGNLLRRLSAESKLVLHGKSKGAFYTIN